MTIGEKVKQYRLEKRMTQEELAKAVGYKARSTITKIEKDVNCPRISMLRKIADYFGVDVWELIGWNEVIMDDLPDDVNYLIKLIKDLTPTERGRVHDFIQGLIAARPRP